MAHKRPCWAVFIDTSIFIGSNYAFSSGSFASLVSLCQTGKVDVVLTDITVREIRTNIAGSLDAAEKAFVRAGAKLRVLRNLTTRRYSGLFEEFNRQECEVDMNKQFDDFLEYTAAEVLEGTGALAKPIFEDYFAKRPPFGAEKKKSEFPDAFAILALSDWASRKNRTLHIVSADGDFASACAPSGPLVYVPTLPEFIELVLADEGVLVSIVHERLKRHENQIRRRIEHEVEGLGIILSDADGEAYLDEIVDTEFRDLSIIGVDKDHAVVEGELKILLKIEVDYNDPDSWYKDDEDKSVHYWNRIQETVEREVDLPASFRLRLSIEEPEVYDISDVTINGNEVIEIYVDEDARTFWK